MDMRSEKQGHTRKDTRSTCCYTDYQDDDEPFTRCRSVIDTDCGIHEEGRGIGLGLSIYKQYIYRNAVIVERRSLNTIKCNSLFYYANWLLAFILHKSILYYSYLRAAVPESRSFSNRRVYARRVQG
jgi:hypothetical protein